MTCIMAAVGVVLASLVGVDGLATGVSTEGTMSLLGLTDADADVINLPFTGQEFEKRPSTNFGFCDADDSVGCGTSVRLQIIGCYNSTDMRVDIKNCAGLPDPQLQTKPCTVTRSCRNQIVNWGACSNSGTQTAIVKCYNMNWGACAQSETDIVTCMKKNREEVASNLCAGYPIPTRSCAEFEKRGSDFGSCEFDDFTGCGTSVMTQNIVCYSKATDMQVDDMENCAGLPDPQVQTMPCTVQRNCVRKNINWGACSTSCGSGFQTEYAKCYNENTNVEVAPYLCEIDLYNATRSCTDDSGCNNPSNGLPPRSDSAESIQCAVGEYKDDDRSCKSCPSVGNCASNECSGPTKGEQQCSACKGGFKLAINSEGGNWCQVRNRCPRGQFPGNDGECVGCPAKWKPKNCEDHFCVGLSKKKETRCGQCAKNFAVSENKRWCKYKPDQV